MQLHGGYRRAAYAAALVAPAKGAGSKAIRATFPTTLERGFAGIRRALKGTPYV